MEGIMHSTTRQRVLTGIQPSGTLHLGNYLGAIRPALALASEHDACYFVADAHALTTVRDPGELNRRVYEVAASLLALGLDLERAVLYRQSDVPEVFELATILSCVTPKGLMNRAHKYKEMTEDNATAGRAPDHGVSMGLFNYPVLMAADILLMGSDVVPVGRDQSQHVEYAADIAGSFNHLFGAHYQFTIPQLVIPEAATAHTLPGVDGRKMSKSYDNTIPLFLAEPELRKLIRRIPTDSTPVEAPKDPNSSTVCQILEMFAPSETVGSVRKSLEAGGMGWGELKDLLFEVLNERLAPLRERYTALMRPGSDLDDILARGAHQARGQAQSVLTQVRHATGIH
jgi:tryptophanyl-tRNA synthetase